MRRTIYNILQTGSLALALLTALHFRAEAQGSVSVNSTGAVADPASILDVSSSDKGVLIPRLALVSTVDPIAGSKPSGLLVWNTSTTGTYPTPGFYYWNSTDWQMLGGGAADNLGNHTATQALNMSSYKIENLANPSSATDGVNAQTVQKGSLIFGAASGTDAYSMSLSPAITAYTTGMVINFIVTNANTGAVTLSVNGLSTVSVLKQGNVALIANDIKANQIVSVIYDGTNFQMISQTGNAGTGGGGGASDPGLLYTIDGF